PGTKDQDIGVDREMWHDFILPQKEGRFGREDRRLDSLLIGAAPTHKLGALPPKVPLPEVPDVSIRASAAPSASRPFAASRPCPRALHLGPGLANHPRRYQAGQGFGLLDRPAAE